MPERATLGNQRSEKSAEVIVAAERWRRAEREGELEAHGDRGTRPQMTRQLELPFEGRGEAPRVERSVEVPMTPVER